MIVHPVWLVSKQSYFSYAHIHISTLITSIEKAIILFCSSHPFSRVVFLTLNVVILYNGLRNVGSSWLAYTTTNSILQKAGLIIITLRTYWHSIDRPNENKFSFCVTQVCTHHDCYSVLFASTWSWNKKKLNAIKRKLIKMTIGNNTTRKNIYIYIYV